MVYGSRTVMAIAPLATLFAYMVGITLGVLISSWGVVVAQTWSAWLVLFVLGFVVVGASLIIGLVLRNLGLGQKPVRR